MAANYWIKLYHEILNDYKMHRLPDNLWRRTIELFLLAGDYDKEGELPPEDEIAFRLRLDPVEFDKEAIELIRVGILSKHENVLIVTNFAKRQAPVSAADRKRYQRKRDAQSQDGHEPVTIGDTDKIREDEIRKDEKEITAADVFKSYEKEIGVLTKSVGDKVMVYLNDEHIPNQWIIDAMEEAAAHNARNWKYASAILDNWAVNGKSKNKKSNTQTGKVDLSNA